MNGNKKKVSVIMAVNKNNSFLGPAIESILSQTFKDFELIIVANNCNDELINYLNTYSDNRIRVFRTPIGQLAFNLNYGLSLARGEFVARMDADDLSMANRLEEQVSYMTKNTGVSVLGTQAEVIDPDGEVIGTLKKPVIHKDIKKALYYRNPFCHPSVMYRRDTILKFKGYFGGQLSEDYGLWLRLARDPKIIFANLAVPLLKYRVHSQQGKGNPLAYAEACGLICTEFLRAPSVDKFLGLFLSVIKYLKVKLFGSSSV